MSTLRDAALAAHAENAERERAERAATAAAKAEKAIRWAIGETPLGKWFPDVVWEFVDELTDGIRLFREKGESGPILGLGVLRDGALDQGPDTLSVIGIYEVAFLTGLISPVRYTRVHIVRSAADVGAYLLARTPAAAPEPAGEEE